MITGGNSLEFANNVVAIAKFFENIEEARAVAESIATEAQRIADKVDEATRVESLDEREARLDALAVELNERDRKFAEMIKAREAEVRDMKIAAQNEVTRITAGLRAKADELELRESDLNARELKISEREGEIEEIRDSLAEQIASADTRQQELMEKLAVVNRHLKSLEITA